MSGIETTIMPQLEQFLKSIEYGGSDILAVELHASFRSKRTTRGEVEQAVIRLMNLYGGPDENV